MGGGPDTGSLGLAQTYALSAASSCIAEGVTYPFDITKTRLQVAGEASSAGAGARRGLVGTMAGIVREEGATQLYRGLAPACLRHCVYSGIRVSAYEALRDHVLQKDEHGNFALWKGVLAGLTAGAVGQFIATPTDVVKVQMQIEVCGVRGPVPRAPQRGRTDACAPHFALPLRRGHPCASVGAGAVADQKGWRNGVPLTGAPGLLLTTRHCCPPPLPGPTHPLPLKRLGQIFFRAFGRSKIFSGAFGADEFRPKVFFGAFGASKTQHHRAGGGGGGAPPQNHPTATP